MCVGTGLAGLYLKSGSLEGEFLLGVGEVANQGGRKPSCGD